MNYKILRAVRAVIATWAPKKKPREVQFVRTAEADKLLQASEGWRLAPEEDQNTVGGWVWLERDAPMTSVVP